MSATADQPQDEPTQATTEGAARRVPDCLWRTALTAALFGLMALLTGRAQPHLGLAAGTLIGGGVTWLYRRCRG